MPVHLVAALVKRLAEITVVAVVRVVVLALAEEIVDNYLAKIKDATTNYYLNMAQIIKDSQGEDFDYIEKIYTYKMYM